MTILKDLSTDDRPREKLLKFGAAYLTKSELLALLLNTSGDRGTSVLDLARTLLTSAGSLRTLAMTDIRTLCQTKGIGPAKAAIILAAFELAHRYEEESNPLPTYFHSPAEIAAHFIPRVRALQKEVFTLLCFGKQQKLLEEKELAVGTLTAVETHPREIFSEAIGCRAIGIILLHNHPSGDPHPSGHDTDITTRIHGGGALLGIPLIDHIILGADGYFSFHEAGLI